MNKLVKQILKFLVVGGIAFLIDYSLLYLFTDILGIHYQYSSALSFTISLIVNYILSIKYVFEVGEKRTKKEFFIFVILSVIGLGINQLIMYLFTDLLKLYYMLSKLVATFIVMVWNFITRKIFIEKK